MKNIKCPGIVLICLTIFICLIVCFLPSIIAKESARLSALSSAATALFTGIAVIWAYCSLKTQQEGLKTQQESLKSQQKDLSRQINLSVFSESIKLLMNSDKYNRGRDYINSKKYDKHLDLVRKVLNKSSNEPVGLGDFSQLLDQELRAKEGTSISKEQEDELRTSYDNIRYFCMRMEYLGVLAEENAAADYIIDYYGYTIETTYEKLDTLIKKTRKEPNSNDLYYHYSNLYEKVIQRKNILQSKKTIT